MLSLDKENAAMVAPRANAKQVIDTGGVPTAPMPSSTTSSLPPSSLFATPKNSNSFNNKLAMTGNTTGNTTGKRRPALCDVTLNTANRAAMMGITPNHHHQTMGITPKFDRRTTLIARALGNDYAKPVATAAAASNKRVTDCSSKVFTLAADDSELEPVERFIGSKYDSFDDLFPDGRLSELFLNNKNKITYVAKLPITDRSRLADDDVLPSICEHSENQPSPISSHLLEPMDEEEQLVELDLPPLASDDDNDYYSDDSSLSDVLHDLTL